MGALKSFFSPALVRRLARDLVRVHPAFPERAFVKRATAGLESLELLDRGRHIAAALAVHLPASYPEAVDVLLRSLGPEHPTDELVGVGMAPFFYLPHLLFVAEHGLNDFELSMRANDLGKLRPDLLEQTCAAWLVGASPEQARRCSRSDIDRWPRASHGPTPSAHYRRTRQARITSAIP